MYLTKSKAKFESENKTTFRVARLFEFKRKSNNLKINKLVKNLKETSLQKVDSDFISGSFYDSDSKYYAVLFSGGIDSLSLAIRHLEKGDKVVLISINFNANEQTIAYLCSRVLKKIYGSGSVRFLKIFSDVFFLGHEFNGGLNQQPICAHYAAYLPIYLMEKAEAVEIAYVMNDNAISFLEELKTIYDTTVKCKYFCENIHTAPLQFPLKQTFHAENIELINIIEKKYNVIFPTVSQENPQVKTYKTKNSTVYLITGNAPDTAPNKNYNVQGYVFVEDF